MHNFIDKPYSLSFGYQVFGYKMKEIKIGYINGSHRSYKKNIYEGEQIKYKELL
jgi:hypothetical protein